MIWCANGENRCSRSRNLLAVTDSTKHLPKVHPYYVIYCQYAYFGSVMAICSLPTLDNFEVKLTEVARLA